MRNKRIFPRRKSKEVKNTRGTFVLAIALWGVCLLTYAKVSTSTDTAWLYREPSIVYYVNRFLFPYICSSMLCLKEPRYQGC